ncbi:MAG: hypothetical protein KQH83_10425 [Actinobacteria bacterium]|nr:hypothetical protein [Actinomycetota bacterium]
MTGPAGNDLQRIIESAARMGVEIDEADALQWMASIAAARAEEGDIAHDEAAGVFGHRVTMLDFSPADLAHFRAIGRLVEFEDADDVETALALSGSAAQSKVQTYPGDCDYFERVNIHASTREAACARLAGLMRGKILSTLEGPTYRFVEAKFGSHPADLERGGRTERAGSPIAWTAAEVEAGEIRGRGPDGSEAVVRWEDAAADPGWCKLDWVVADPARDSVANASNMLDVTWEAPDGTITPLDGYLDPYFQEVYLEAESIPLFTKLAEHVSDDALAEYVEQLEKEVRKYVGKEPRNYGKAAKRMYNIFRLDGRYAEAAYVRELFDEPAALLYQVHALIRTIDEAAEPGSSITPETVLAQLDRLVLDVVRTLEGAEEVEIVEHLQELRSGLIAGGDRTGRDAAVEQARARVINLVNNFFHDRLVAMPEIAAYLDEVSAG